MSHSSGIAVSENLRNAFGEALQTENIRLLKVQIQNETELNVTKSEKISGNFEQDFSKIVPLLEPNVATYILYRTDEKGISGYKWLILCYVPDKAKVREKMLYASTRANLKLQLGGANFHEDIFGTVPEDFSWSGYQKHVGMQKAEVPLTAQEITRKEEEESGGVYVGGGGAYVHGVTFPCDDSAIKNLKSLKDGDYNYIQLKIDTEKELIQGGEVGNVNVDELGSHVSAFEPQFHFFRWNHEFDGEDLASLVFIYSCPDGTNNTKPAPVKLRMLYSSSKANAEELAKKQGLEINAKLEVNTGVEITEEYLSHTLHPQKEEKKQKFTKPKGPGAGGRRLNRK